MKEGGLIGRVGYLGDGLMGGWVDERRWFEGKVGLWEGGLMEGWVDGKVG